MCKGSPNHSLLLNTWKSCIQNLHCWDTPQYNVPSFAAVWDRRCEIGVYLAASRPPLSFFLVSAQARQTLFRTAPTELINNGLQGKEWLAE